MPETLVVNEIYLSLQGESTFAGLPCVFIRLTGCDLRCSYCDTAYAFSQGEKTPLSAIITEVQRLSAAYAPAAGARLPLVELTGGEPLLQAAAPHLMTLLCEEGYTVLLETSGAHDIAVVDARVRRIVDFKCPSSGELARNRWENLVLLKATDEIKFVISTEEDYAWAKTTIAQHDLHLKCNVLMSWAAPLTAAQRDKSLKAVPGDSPSLTRTQLAERIVADALPVRFQIQMHKVVWAPDKKGV